MYSMSMVQYDINHGGSPGFLETIMEEDDVYEDAVSELDSVYSDAESSMGETVLLL